jgi:hypothetical protein
VSPRPKGRSRSASCSSWRTSVRTRRSTPRAFDNAKLPEPLRLLLDKVATKSAQVTDADFATAMEAGFTDDQFFELVVCAVVGQSTRQYEALCLRSAQSGRLRGGREISPQAGLPMARECRTSIAQAEPS